MPSPHAVGGKAGGGGAEIIFRLEFMSGLELGLAYEGMAGGGEGGGGGAGQGAAVDAQGK